MVSSICVVIVGAVHLLECRDLLFRFLEHLSVWSDVLLDVAVHCWQLAGLLGISYFVDYHLAEVLQGWVEGDLGLELLFALFC